MAESAWLESVFIGSILNKNGSVKADGGIGRGGEERGRMRKGFRAGLGREGRANWDVIILFVLFVEELLL